MAAASVASPTMALAVANPPSDPRHVVTPLDPDQAEELLRKYNLVQYWGHVITGLREGFDVGDKPPSSLDGKPDLFLDSR
jgi:hypothetical protein